MWAREGIGTATILVGRHDIMREMIPRFKNPCHFSHGMGFHLGVFGFSKDQNNHDLLRAYVTHPQFE